MEQHIAHKSGKRLKRRKDITEGWKHRTEGWKHRTEGWKHREES